MLGDRNASAPWRESERSRSALRASSACQTCIEILPGCGQPAGCNMLQRSVAAADRGTPEEHAPCETPQNAPKPAPGFAPKVPVNRSIRAECNLHGKEGVAGSSPAEGLADLQGFSHFVPHRLRRSRNTRGTPSPSCSRVANSVVVVVHDAYFAEEHQRNTIPFDRVRRAFFARGLRAPAEAQRIAGLVAFSRLILSSVEEHQRPPSRRQGA
jgi:hypothetical protein